MGSSFRPETLTCRAGQNASTCLTGDQIGALRRIYADYYEADQTYVFGGYYPGGETEYYKGLVGKKQFDIGLGYFQFMVLKYVSYYFVPSVISMVNTLMQRYQLQDS